MKHITILILTTILTAVLGYTMTLVEWHALIEAGVIGLGVVPLFIASIAVIEGFESLIKHRRHIKTLLNQDKANREQYEALYAHFREDSDSYYDATIKAERQLINAKQQELDNRLDKYINEQVDIIDKAEHTLTELIKLK